LFYICKNYDKGFLLFIEEYLYHPQRFDA